jgi:PAS domain S-box-containing protein
VLWNPAAEALLGYSAAEARNLTIDALVPERFRAAHIAGRSRYAATGHGPFVGAGRPIAVAALRHDGTEVEVELTLSALERPPDAGCLVLAMLHDLTDHRRLEGEHDAVMVEQVRLLEEAQARLRRLIEAEQQARQHAEQEHTRLLTVIEASHDAIYLKDLAGRYVLVNAAKARMLQRQPQDIVGKRDRDLGPPSYWEPAVASDHQVVASGEPAARYQSVDIAGVTHLIYAIKTPLRDNAGTIIGIVGVLRDITEPTRLAEERDAAHAAQARAEGAVRTGRAVAHELASPLGAMLAMAEILAPDPRLPEDIRRDLTMIQEQAVRAGDLLKRFGSITRYAEQETPAGPQLDVLKASG